MKKTILLLLILILPITAFAQRERNQGNTQKNPRNVTSGTFDVLEDKPRNTFQYEENENKTIAQLKNLAQNVSGNSVKTQSSFPDYMISFISANYLHCSIKKGVCPFFLDSIMETDIINSKLSNTPACPNMKKFWRDWIDNDMQKRWGHKVRTGLLNRTQEFKKNQLPAYVKCKDTIQKILDKNKDKSAADFFKERYGKGSKMAKSLSYSAKYMELIKNSKQKIPNIFIEVGLSTPK